MDLPDEVWVERARQDPEAFAELVQRYQDKLYNLGLRLTGDPEEARDLTQESLLRAYRALPTFRAGLRFSPWMYKIATNLCLNHLKQRREKVPLDPTMPVLDPLDGPERAVERAESQAAVQRAILNLPRQYRMVIVLRHFQDLSYDEIAQVLDLPLGTVKIHLFRAREMLARRLLDHSA